MAKYIMPMNETDELVWANAFAIAWVAQGESNAKASASAEHVLRMLNRRRSEGELYKETTDG